MNKNHGKTLLKACLILMAVLFIMTAGFAGGLYYYGSQLYASGSAKWEDEVSAIEARYNGNYPQDGIIFYGSSSIRLWDTLSDDLAPLEVYNHGFGGSTLDDAVAFADRLIFPFHPRAVVIYSGTNDMGSDIPGYGKDEREGYLMSVALISYIREELPDADVFYIASTPNGFRWKLWPRMEACNSMMESWCDAHEHVFYIDTVPSLLDENGSYRDEFFQDDHLHFNEKGYAIWASVIKQALTEAGYRES